MFAGFAAEKYFIYGLFFIALLSAIVPAVFVVKQSGGWQGVPPEGIADSLYYYSRIHEVLDGHPLIGNPYVYEYRNELSPAFFIPDALAAIPVLLGMPFDIAIVWNAFFWGFVFLLLLYSLFRFFHLPPLWAFLGALFSYASSYSFMLRPISMQIIFPLSILFLLVLVRWRRAPFQKRKILDLALVSALTFYAYAYLAYVVFITLAALFIFFLVRREKALARSLFRVGMFAILFLLPFIAYEIVTLHNPLYFETLKRLGLVATRIPSIEALYYGRWVVFVLLAFWFFRKSGFCVKMKLPEYSALFAWVGFGLLITSVLNVFTGVELTLAIHVGRLILLWTAICLVTLLFVFLDEKLWRGRTLLLLPSAVLILALTVGTLRNLPRALVFFSFPEREDLHNAQKYAGPLRFLNSNAPHGSVIFTNDDISQYVPILTTHYPMFSPSDVLQIAPSREIEERYLLSRSFGTTSRDILKNDFILYAGAGLGKEQPLAENRRIALCNLAVRMYLTDRKCGEKTDAISLVGGAYFDDLLSRAGRVRVDRGELLKRYGVSYILVDRMKDAPLPPDILPRAEKAYDDGRFIVYNL